MDDLNGPEEFFTVIITGTTGYIFKRNVEVWVKVYPSRFKSELTVCEGLNSDSVGVLMR